MKKNSAKNKTALWMGTAVTIALGTAVVKSQTTDPMSSQSSAKIQTTGNVTVRSPEQINMEGRMHLPDVFKFPDYTKTPADEVEPQTIEVLEQRSRAISKLVMQIENSQTSEVAKAELMYLLGSLRSVEAVTTLIENINFVDNRVILKSRFSDRGGHIARRALIKIGEPSARWIYLIIADDHNLDTVRFDESQVDGFVEVLSGIETPKIALTNLRAGRENAKSAKIKAQYDLVIAGMEKL